MTISVHIDTNAWNFLFDNKIGINRELPSEDFKLFITREVEIEMSAILDEGKDGADKRPLKHYIRHSLARNCVTTTATFGFAEANLVGGPNVFADFGQGTFQSGKQRAWYSQDKVRNSILGKKKKGSGLSGNQADAAVAAAAFDSVVLTCDKKRGPIHEASEQGKSSFFRKISWRIGRSGKLCALLRSSRAEHRESARKPVWIG